jgi:hypothetical protein
VRRKAEKDLFNALDNDGSLEAWERRQGCPAMMQMPPFAVGTDGEVFSLRAYQDSRRALTGEFTRRMPTLVAFVRAWLALHKPDNEHKFALTAKSFFLQEAEGLSRAAMEYHAKKDSRVAKITIQDSRVVQNRSEDSRLDIQGCLDRVLSHKRDRILGNRENKYKTQDSRLTLSRTIDV